MFGIFCVANLYAENTEPVKESGKKPMTEEDFINIYVPLSIAAQNYLTKPDTLRAKQDSIFEQSGFSRDDFNNFREKADKDPQEWNQIYKRIVEKLDKLTEAETEQKKVNSSRPGPKKVSKPE